MANKKTNDHTSRKRIPALDIIRGIFLVIIAVDHLAWSPSLFIEVFTNKSWFFASAAEGFFAISGILVGYIYGPRILSHTRSVFKKIFYRAGKLYILAISFTLIYTVWSFLLPSPPIRLDMPITHLPEMVYKSLTLQYSYGWTDFLARYTIFMLIAPIVLWLIAKGKSLLVVVLSILGWILAQHYTSLATYLAWQIIFMNSIIIGYYLPKIELFFQKIHENIRTKIYVFIIVIAVVSYILPVSILYLLQYAHIIFNEHTIWIAHEINIRYEKYKYLFDRNTIGILRILVGAVWFSALYIIVRKNEYIINKLTRHSLEFLGKNSLLVYSLQGFIIFSIDALFPTPYTQNIFLNTFIGFIFVLTMYMVTLLIKQYKRNSSIIKNHETPRIRSEISS